MNDLEVLVLVLMLVVVSGWWLVVVVSGGDYKVHSCMLEPQRCRPTE